MPKVYRKYNDYHKVENNITYKKCQDCLEWFEMNLTNFGSDKSTTDKHNVRCKKCQKIYQDEYYAKTGDIQRAKANKRLENEEIRKKNQLYFKFWYIRNAEKDRADTNRYREEHPDYSRFHNQKYLASDSTKESRRKHSRFRQQHKLHKVSTKQWELCKKYFNHRCAYCGLAIENHYITRKGITKLCDFDKEHIIDEGSNSLKNCVPSCKSCNSKKHTTSFNNWYNPNNPVYDRERYLVICQWMKSGCKEVLKLTYKPKKIKK